VITVNDRAITGFELQERERFLALLRAPGDHKELARTQLIEDRLKLGAAQAAGVQPGADEVLAGMEEFAGRANLTREEFVKAITSAGVSEQAFRDFVTAGLAWRQLVQARFGGRVSVSEAEVDRALNSTTKDGGVRVLLSEIIMALFQLRDIEETKAPNPEFAAIEYAAYYIAGGRTEAALAEAQRIAGRVDRCDDLYGIAKGQDPSVLERGAKKPSEIPSDIALELARMDPGETSTTLTRANGQTLVLLMLCGVPRSQWPPGAPCAMRCLLCGLATLTTCPPAPLLHC